MRPYIQNVSFSDDTKHEEDNTSCEGSDVDGEENVRSEVSGVGGENDDEDETVDVADLNHKDSYNIQIKKNQD